MQLIEQKQMFGHREEDSDGFTYVHGKFKAGRIKRTRNKQHTARLLRHDKRAVKQKSMKRMLSEYNY